MTAVNLCLFILNACAVPNKPADQPQTSHYVSLYFQNSGLKRALFPSIKGINYWCSQKGMTSHLCGKKGGQRNGSQISIKWKVRTFLTKNVLKTYLQVLHSSILSSIVTVYICRSLMKKLMETLH